jgi:hypothetical protein
MYDKIMRSSSHSFFALFSLVLPGDTEAGNNVEVERNRTYNENKSVENEWIQEYRIIYNAYILDIEESAGLI